MTERRIWKRNRSSGALERLEVVTDAIAGLSNVRQCVLEHIGRGGWTEDAHALEVALAVAIGDLMALQSRLYHRDRHR